MKKYVLLMLVYCQHSYASELVYTPINPSFGGNPLNASMLMNKAQAQNKHKAHVEPKSYAEKMQESLERAYINRIVREVTDLAFGESSDENVFGQDSVFTSGDYQIQLLTSNADSITIQITHLISGEVTTIEIPRFG
ncbi:curli assembly protein CsgF [Pseudoalteromonas byunsanensis]|uniref:Curli production assembly/transport component CsgF n=1 Tax=Pseudoalteromonas byunsanensis TaxID=327939 RepID=A0A1S1MY81_9GAMM|nr:curli assembly protein CsgF [Pseudoalteromonas byunsanensis]OHU93880.1 curli production assembly protein CsgF [Pseudoalteromonas byunsanensis]